MTKRLEAAASTRRALLDAAAALLDGGGPAAVTLREVGAIAGVTRGAPYRHFPDKENLLTEVAAEGWDRLGQAMLALRANPQLLPGERLRAALTAILLVARRQPHLYQLMFTAPHGDPDAVVRAAQRMCDEFLDLVAPVVGPQNSERSAAILLTGVHGAAGLASSGLLVTDKWHTTADDLVDTLLDVVMEIDRPG
jgi:AcrR family transcriptional regulator